MTIFRARSKHSPHFCKHFCSSNAGQAHLARLLRRMAQYGSRLRLSRRGRRDAASRLRLLRLLPQCAFAACLFASQIRQAARAFAPLGQYARGAAMFSRALRAYAAHLHRSRPTRRFAIVAATNHVFSKFRCAKIRRTKTQPGHIPRFSLFFSRKRELIE